MNRYDIIYSLGRDCSCAMYMQQTNLRSCSGPFDWLTNAGFEKRFELMINNFDEFLEQSDLLPMDKPTAFPSDKNNDYYENVKTGLYYWHDFPAGVPLQESFNIVKEKYNRRIKRFYDNILTKNRVLLIWFSQVGSTSDSVVLEYCDKLCSKIGKKLDFLIIEHREGVFEPQCIRLAENIVRWYCHCQKNDGSGKPTMLGNEKLVRPIFEQYKLIVPPVLMVKNAVFKYLIKFICLFVPVKKWRKRLRQWGKR